MSRELTSSTLAENSAVSRIYNDRGIPVTAGELWTARQRQMHPIHYTISYRASFKPELPDFFIKKYLPEQKKGPFSGDTMVLDPFGGRGTTIMQANMMGFAAHHNDLNPVASFIARARKAIPPLQELTERLENLRLNENEGRPTELEPADQDRLLPFFHPRTLQEILAFRGELLDRLTGEDPHMLYLGVTALSRLYGHSDGFFSVYTFPQISIMPGAQRKNNLRRNQSPQYRPIRERIARKMKKDLSIAIPEQYHRASSLNSYGVEDSRDMSRLPAESVDLVVTSPPFLDKVDYVTDNWMRSWFLGMEERTEQMELSIYSELSDWSQFMKDTLVELGRVLKPGARAVIEVGEVKSRKKTIPLEEVLMDPLPLPVPGGTLVAEEIFLNVQQFTKLAHCWDVKNNTAGTNTNRCLVIRKEA